MAHSPLVHCAAADLGATSGRVIVGAWDGRRLALTEVHRFPSQFHSVGGHAYWDLPGLWQKIITGLRAARSLADVRRVIARQLQPVVYPPRAI